jgi:hypothetical protein
MRHTLSALKPATHPAPIPTTVKRIEATQEANAMAYGPALADAPYRQGQPVVA